MAGTRAAVISLLDQVIAIPNVFVADEAEEFIGNATPGWRDFDLF